MSPKRVYIVLSALLALFLGALDTLVMGAAMPTVVADLRGLHLYSWVFSVYLLSRAISLPIYGKLADLFSTRKLFMLSIAIFIAGSVAAGIATSMVQLIFGRILQGIGAGGNFALVYIVLSDIATPGKRGKMMSLASFVWGVASVLGPSMGGFIVNYFSWRWIFFINVPLGGLSFIGIYLFFNETRDKRKRIVIDYAGAVVLSTAILSLLTALLLGGGRFAWYSWQVSGLLGLSIAAAAVFYRIEKRAAEPILPIEFFRVKGFSIGNAAVLCCSFAIFSLSAFCPLFIQGALGRSPARLGLAMIALSLAWSLGALVCGQSVHRIGKRKASLIGAALLVGGCLQAVTFTSDTSLLAVSVMLTLTGTGMGFVSIATLLIVQDSLPAGDLGVSTSVHQFARTLGGTVGIGVSGSLLNVWFSAAVDRVQRVASDVEIRIPAWLIDRLSGNLDSLFHPEVQAQIPLDLLSLLQEAVGGGVMVFFRVALAAALLCLICCLFLPSERGR